jgi:deoxyribonuclease V
LPILRAVLAQLAQTPAAILIDGYVQLDRAGLPGLGAHLYDALNSQTPVIGMAKTAFRNDNWSALVSRGESQNPLRVTAIGMDLHDAAENVRAMAGEHRIPAMLKLADQTARAAASD